MTHKHNNRDARDASTYSPYTHAHKSSYLNSVPTVPDEQENTAADRVFRDALRATDPTAHRPVHASVARCRIAAREVGSVGTARTVHARVASLLVRAWPLDSCTNASGLVVA